MNEFFAGLYELFSYQDQFSTDLYNHGLYSSVGSFLVLSSFAAVVVFYYLINHPRFNRWFHWAIVLLVSLCINFWWGFDHPRDVLSRQGIEYGSEFYAFAIINAGLSIVIFTMMSFLLRWWSRNCSRTPIPQ